MTLQSWLKAEEERKKKYYLENRKLCVLKCMGCDRVVVENEQPYCKSYLDPEVKWRPLGVDESGCNFCTHLKEETAQQKVVNALKASKRKARGR